LHAARVRPNWECVKKPKLLAPPPAPRWTRIDDYVLALARLRSVRRRHPARPRSQPEEPRLLLSTLPFLVLTVALGLLALAIIVAAWPGRERPHPRAETAEPGTAPPDWFDKAKREMR
jgi:hypothetical protein